MRDFDCLFPGHRKGLPCIAKSNELRELRIVRECRPARVCCVPACVFRDVLTIAGIDCEPIRFAAIDRKHLFSIPDREKENRGPACGLKMAPRLSTLTAWRLYIMLTIVNSD
jgi:hypothetical protein